MKRFQKPSLHSVLISCPADGGRIAALPDAELEACLRERGYWKNKTLYRVCGDYVYRRIAGEGVLVPTGGEPGNEMVTLNDTCAFLWEQLREPGTIGDLVEAARREYDDPEHALEAQVYEFVEDGIKNGYIQEE